MKKTGEETSPGSFICNHSFSFICRELKSGANTCCVWNHVIPITSAVTILLQWRWTCVGSETQAAPQGRGCQMPVEEVWDWSSLKPSLPSEPIPGNRKYHLTFAEDQSVSESNMTILDVSFQDKTFSTLETWGNVLSSNRTGGGLRCTCPSFSILL